LTQKLNSLEEEIESVALLGARPAKIFLHGVFPQILPQVSLMSGLAAVWAMGDFAMARVIAGADMTLAMWVQSLVDQYRWDMALVLSWLILLTSFGVFSFFWSLSYVSHQKLNEDV
jgi:ABC-type sulfate transport system permease component